MPQQATYYASNNYLDDSLKFTQPIKPEPVRTKLYVSNFTVNCTRRHLTEFFSKYGQVLECAIMWDKYAFIHYGSMEEAQNALSDANNLYLMGQKLCIQLSTSRNRQKYDWYQQEAAKLHQELLTKSNENQSMSSSCSSSNLLVETKLYVTNLPENCNQLELKSLFEQYGNVLECVIMWNHYAFVHFADIRQAKIALENLHGYLFYGKNLIVQFSTSSNRPLPKCLVFSNCSYTSNNKDFNTSENESDEKNWIQKIKNGCLPVIQQTQSQSQPEELSKIQIDLKALFNHDVKSSKSESSTKKSETSSTECSSSLSSVSAQRESNNDDSEADADTDLELISIEAVELKKVLSKNKKSINAGTSRKKLNEMIRLDQVPTPPLPNQSLSQYNKIQSENNSLKKLIHKINKKESEVLDLNANNRCNNKLDDQENNDLKNEKILIEQLNSLKMQNETVLSGLECLNEQPSEEASPFLPQTPMLRIDNILNSLKTQSQPVFPNFVEYRSEMASHLVADESSMFLPQTPLLRIDNIFKPSRSISSSSDEKISSTLSSPTSYTIDFLNSKCLYEENLIKQNYDNDQYYDNDQSSKVNEETSPNASTNQTFETFNAEHKTNKKMSRCRVVNYILFPELNEQNFFDKNQFENEIVNLVKQHAKIVI